MNIIDIIILIILAISLASGLYKGFITSTLSLIGFCGSWIASLSVYQYVVNAVRSNEGIMNFLGSITGAVDLFKTQGLANMQVASATAADIDQAMDEIGIPLINNLFKNNVTEKVFANAGKFTMNEYLSETLLSAALNIVAFILTFVVIYIAALLVVNLLNNVFRFPQLRHFDAILGGIFGLLRGVVIVMLVFAVIPTISSALASMDISLLNDLIDESKFGAIFTNTNIISELLQKRII